MNTKGPATEAHERHMATLNAMKTNQQISDHIEQVRRTDGAFYAKWLREDFAAWWRQQGRKGQETRK